MELKNNPTLKDFQEYIFEMCKERGFKNNSDRGQLFAHLLEEAGELASSSRKFEKGRVEKEEIELEIADVLIFILHIANKYEIDLESAFRKKEEINKKRNWN